MLKYVSLMGLAAMLLFGCCAKPAPVAPQVDKLGDLQSQLANYRNACANIAFTQTNAKVNEAVALKEQGKKAESDAATEEAIELFSAERAQYGQLNSDNEALGARIADVNAKHSSVDASVQALPDTPEAADVRDEWEAAHPEVVRHIEAAEAAYANCDPATGNAELDAAEALLDKIAALVAGVPAPSECEVYTVKRGDSLWKIAGEKYGEGELWPLIYGITENSDKIGTNPHRYIYPGQELEICFSYTDEDKENAREYNKAHPMR